MIAMESQEADRFAMQRLREGDDLALNDIIQRWKQPLTNYLFRHLGQEHEAIDLAQETFVRIYENRMNYRPEGKFSTWLFTIAINLCRNHIRWKKRHPAISLSDMNSPEIDHSIEIPDSQPTPSASFLKNEQKEAVWSALHELPHDLKTSLLLFEFEDHSHQEVSP